MRLLTLRAVLYLAPLCLCPPPSDGQLSWERPMQVVEAGGQGPEGRALTLGLHQLPVRPVTQNGQHTSTVVATSLANAYGTVPPPRCSLKHTIDARLLLLIKDKTLSMTDGCMPPILKVKEQHNALAL